MSSPNSFVVFVSLKKSTMSAKYAHMFSNIKTMSAKVFARCCIRNDASGNLLVPAYDIVDGLVPVDLRATPFKEVVPIAEPV